MKFFRNAPISKVLLFGTIIITVLNGTSPDFRALMGGVSRSTIENGQYWRLFTSQWPAEDLGSLLVMCFFIYSYRFVAATVYPCANVPSGPVSGPYHIVFGLLPVYFAYVPSITLMSFSITRNFSIPISEKVPQYIAAVLLTVAAGVRSWALVPLSLLFGIVYLLPFLHCKRLRLPRALRNFCSRKIRPMIEGGSRPVQTAQYRRVDRYGGANPLMHPVMQQQALAQFMNQVNQANLPRGVNGGDAHPRFAAPPADVPIDETSVTTLVEMGFTEEQARRALRETNGNVELAVSRLVS